MLGQSSSKSASIEKRPLQHPRDVGPFVHDEAGAEVLVSASLVGKTTLACVVLVLAVLVLLCHEADIFADVAPLLGTVYVRSEPASHSTVPSVRIRMNLYVSFAPAAMLTVVDQSGFPDVYCAAVRGTAVDVSQLPSSVVEPMTCMLSPQSVVTRMSNVIGIASLALCRF